MLKKKEQHRLHCLWLAETCMNDPSARQKMEEAIANEKARLQAHKEEVEQELAELQEKVGSLDGELGGLNQELDEHAMSSQEKEMSVEEATLRKDEAKSMLTAIKAATIGR